MSDFLINMNWRQPLWLLVMLQPLLLWLALRWLKNRNQQNYADKDLLPWITVQKNHSIWQRIFSRDTAYFLVWIGFAIALAGPRIPDNNSDPGQTKFDVMLVVDLSRSMYTTDIKPSRLRRATLEAYEFLSIAESSKQYPRVGVLVYAARPHLYVPLTTDYMALEFYLRDLDTLQLPTLGSDPATAILLAQKELAKSNSASRNIVWLTDSDIEKSQFESIEKAISKSTIKTHVLALASTEGAAIPLKNGMWLESEGQAVISKPNFEWVSKLLKRWGGVFSIVKDSESDWEKIYQQGILSNMPQDLDGNNEQWKELHNWALIPALMVFFIALFPSLKFAFVLIILFVITVLSTANADDSFLDDIFKGANAYQTQQFTLAKSKFIQAVLDADTQEQRAIALHNLGNSLFQIGDYESASKLFNDALRYNPQQKQSIDNQQLSTELNNILLRRLKNAQMRGNLSIPNQNSILLNLPKQLPSRVNTKAVNRSKFKLPEIPKEDLSRLLEKGLSHIQLLQSGAELSEAGLKQKQEINEARLHLLGLQGQGTTSSNPLWKRLFEIEEGFPGKLKKPEKIPGVKSW